MDTRVFSAYNLARGVLLNSRLTLADSGNQPLKLLDIVVSGMGMDPTKGLWLIPLHAIPAVPRVFPFDLVYLDKEYRVLDTAEMGPGTEFPVFKSAVASALVLPSDVLHRTGTVVGDRLIVCPATELDVLLAPTRTDSTQVASPETLHAHAAKSVGDTRNLGAPVIELVPEKPVPVHSPRVVPGFEHSIQSALARIEDQPQRSAEGTSPKLRPDDGRVTPGLENSAESLGSRSAGSFSPGPSIDVSEVVLERSKQGFAPIIEHRIDPEDLFANWVVSPPPAPVVGAKADPVLASAAAATARNENQNIPKAPVPDRSADRINLAETQASEDETTTAQQKPRAASGRSDKAAAKSKQAPEKPKQAAARAIPVPQPVPATTFTAVPYGMWQVSMPTAVAPLNGKTAGSAKVSTEQNPLATAQQPKISRLSQVTESQQVSSSVATGTKSAPAEAPIKAPDSRPEQPKEGALRTTAAPSGKEFEAAPRPVVTAPAAAQKHTPGDFVASLQEKLQRVQQSKPEPEIRAQASRILESEPNAAAKSSHAGMPAASQFASVKTDELAPTSKFLKTVASETTSSGGNREEAANSVTSQSRPERANTEHSAGGFRSRFKQWFNPVSTPSDRRRSGRRYVPGVVAHYFTGGAPKPHEVADISMSGMYLLTEDRWMPGTMIQMTLQKPCARGERKQSINVLSRIVRRGSDGVAAEFVMSETLSRVSHDIQPSQATDKFALARFL